MEKFEENAIKIADYLENKMSSEEEEAFMRELGNDAELRGHYEEELLMHAMFKDAEDISGKKEDMFFQPADEHISMIEAALKKQERPQSRISQLFKQYGSIAAIFLLVVAAVVVLMLVKFNNNNSKNIAVKPVNKDTSIHHDTTINILPKEQIVKTNKPENKHNKIDSTKKEEPLVATNNSTANSLLKKFYTPYSKDEDDPAELKSYYASLKKRDYKNVIDATDADYQLMGTGDRNELLKQYMSLYKGLSYMATNNTASAIKNFDEVLNTAGRTDRVYYNAQWYLTLTYLKENNIQKSLSVLETISQSESPFKLQAEQLKQQLKK